MLVLIDLYGVPEEIPCKNFMILYENPYLNRRAENRFKDPNACFKSDKTKSTDHQKQISA